MNREKKMVLVSFLVLIILNAADVVTTIVGLQHGGFEVDGETIFLMKALGITEALLLKVFLVVSMSCISIFFYLRSRLNYGIFVVALLIANLYYLKLVFGNSLALWRLLT